MSNTTRIRIAAVAALAVCTLLTGGLALAQGSPVGGNIVLGLAASNLAPPNASNFTVDLTIDMTNATGTCTTGGATVPMTLGAFNTGITYDSTKLTFVSAAFCPTAPAQFQSAPSCNNIAGTPAEVVCNNLNSGNTNVPTGSVCVVRYTFTNIGATTASPAVINTKHTPGPRSISTNLVTSPTACGGPITFPAGSITDGATPNITPAVLTIFSAN